MQDLVRVAYPLATHEERAIVGVAAYGCVVGLPCYLAVGRLSAIGHIMRISFFGLYQCAQLQTSQYHVGDGLFEEAG